MLLCHNPPQENGSTSPFNYLSPREANHLQFTAPVVRVVGLHYLKGGCGIEQRRLTPDSNNHLPRLKATALPPSLTCAEPEEKPNAFAHALFRPLSTSLVDQLVLGILRHQGPETGGDIVDPRRAVSRNECPSCAWLG